jgi:hypothetical protein
VSQVVILPRVVLDQVKTELRAAAWFAALGEPLTDGDRADADAYAKALGLGTLVLGQARDWPEAERVLKAPDWSPIWWDREEVQRRRLLAEAEEAAPPFESKFRLFAAGRWPLGVVGSTLVLF